MSHSDFDHSTTPYCEKWYEGKIEEAKKQGAREALNVNIQEIRKRIGIILEDYGGHRLSQNEVAAIQWAINAIIEITLKELRQKAGL